MPRGDKTGPRNAGAMAGRGAGYCAGFGTPGFANPRVRGGRAQGWKRGYRNMYHATGVPGWVRFGYGPASYSQEQVQKTQGYDPEKGYDPEQEREILKNQAEYLKQHLEEVNKRIQELEDENEKEEKED